MLAGPLGRRGKGAAGEGGGCDLPNCADDTGGCRAAGWRGDGGTPQTAIKTKKNRTLIHSRGVEILPWLLCWCVLEVAQGPGVVLELLRRWPLRGERARTACGVPTPCLLRRGAEGRPSTL